MKPINAIHRGYKSGDLEVVCRQGWHRGWWVVRGPHPRTGEMKEVTSFPPDDPFSACQFRAQMRRLEEAGA